MDLERSKQYYIACCCIPRKNRDHKLKIRRIINLLTLSPQKKAILLDRYVDLVNNYRIQSFWYSYTFNTLRFIIQIGSLLTQHYSQFNIFMKVIMLKIQYIGLHGVHH